MNRIRKCVLFVASAALVLFCAVFLLPKLRGDRRVLYFPSAATQKARREVRRFPSGAGQGALRSCVDELLLGSARRGRLALFSPGTACEFCFVQGSVAFVGLSGEAALQLPGSADIETGMKLFRASILSNFKYIDCVELFIGGNYIESR